MKRLHSILSLLTMVALLLASCAAPAAEETPGGAAQPTMAAIVAMEEPTEAAVPTEAMAPTEAVATEPTETTASTPAAEGTTAPIPQTGGVTFFSSQFTPVEEQEKFRAILQEEGFDFTVSEEGPLIDLVLAGAQAGQAEVDVIGSLHGTFPPLQNNMMNMIDVVDDLSADREFTEAFLETGLLGTDDNLAYVPWMQATYIMAAHNDALEYLPEGADINALT